MTHSVFFPARRKGPKELDWMLSIYRLYVVTSSSLSKKFKNQNVERSISIDMRVVGLMDGIKMCCEGAQFPRFDLVESTYIYIYIYMKLALASLVVEFMGVKDNYLP